MVVLLSEVILYSNILNVLQAKEKIKDSIILKLFIDVQMLKKRTLKIKN